MNRIAIVVLNWNGADFLEECLESLRSQDYPQFQIVIVDNGSTDNSRDILDFWTKQHGDKVRVIYNDKNLGFAGGVNVGIRYAMDQGFDAVALLNNDAKADPSWLSILVETMRTYSDSGIVTGLFLRQDGQKIDSTGDWYSVWGLAFPRLRDESVEKTPESGYVFGGTGGASLYRMEMFKEIGLFDERFFAYYEDVDVSFRAQLAGWKVYFTSKAIAYHDHGTTSGRIPGFSKYQMFKNLPMLYWKNVPSGLLFKVGLRFKLIYLLMFVNAILRGNIGPAFKGAFAAITSLPYSLGQRRKIQSSKKVTSEYIDSIIYQELPPNQKGKLSRVVKFFRRG